MNSFPLLLASTSPRRAELITSLGFPFDCFAPPDCELTESTRGLLSPKAFVLHNAHAKADQAQEAFPHHLILAADTLVTWQNRFLGKPRDLEQAHEFLTLLSGQSHQVLTGTVLRLPTGKRKERVEMTQVFFKKLTTFQIKAYLQKVHVLDKAGAYALQEHPEDLIEKVEGSESNVMGLPLAAVKSLLQEAQEEGFSLQVI